MADVNGDNTQPGFVPGYSNLLQNSFLGDLIGTAADVAQGYLTIAGNWSAVNDAEALRKAQINKAKIDNNLSLSNTVASASTTQIVLFSVLVGIGGFLLYKAVK